MTAKFHPSPVQKPVDRMSTRHLAPSAVQSTFSNLPHEPNYQPPPSVSPIMSLLQQVKEDKLSKEDKFFHEIMNENRKCSMHERALKKCDCEMEEYVFARNQLMKAQWHARISLLMCARALRDGFGSLGEYRYQAALEDCILAQRQLLQEWNKRFLRNLLHWLMKTGSKRWKWEIAKWKCTRAKREHDLSRERCTAAQKELLEAKWKRASLPLVLAGTTEVLEVVDGDGNT